LEWTKGGGGYSGRILSVVRMEGQKKKKKKRALAVGRKWVRGGKSKGTHKQRGTHGRHWAKKAAKGKGAPKGGGTGLALAKKKS